MKNIKKNQWILLTIVVMVGGMILMSCKPEATATPEQLPTYTPTVTLTPIPTETPMPTFTATPYPSDPASWDLSGSVTMVDDATGMKRYTLEQWQIMMVLEQFREYWNKYVGKTLVPPEEMIQYFDPESEPWVGSENFWGYPQEYEHNSKVDMKDVLEFPIEDPSHYQWQVWGAEIINEYGEREMRIVVKIEMAEQTRYIIQPSTGEVLKTMPYFGPWTLLYHYRFVDGQWVICYVNWTDRGEVYTLTPTP